jgi:hypothetical protein
MEIDLGLSGLPSRCAAEPCHAVLVRPAPRLMQKSNSTSLILAGASWE